MNSKFKIKTPSINPEKREEDLLEKLFFLIIKSMRAELWWRSWWGGKLKIDWNNKMKIKIGEMRVDIFAALFVEHN